MSSSLTKRIFHLYGVWLFYFSNENDDARAKGIIPIKGAVASIYELNDKDKKKNEKSQVKLQYCLSIKTNIPREYVLSCSTEVKKRKIFQKIKFKPLLFIYLQKERDDWIQIIKEQSSKVISKAGKGGLSEDLIKKLLGSTEDVRDAISKGSKSDNNNNNNTPSKVFSLHKLIQNSKLQYFNPLLIHP